MEECLGGTNLASLGRNLVIDEVDIFSEPESTKMEQDDVLHIEVSDADLSIDSLVGGHLSGDSQPAPSDQIPLTGETLPGFSQSAPSVTPIPQPAPPLQPMVIPKPQLTQAELMWIRSSCVEFESMEQQGKMLTTMQSEKH